MEEREIEMEEKEGLKGKGERGWVFGGSAVAHSR